MTTLYHTPIPTNAPAIASTFNTVYSDLDSVSEDALNGWAKKGANVTAVSRAINVTSGYHILNNFTGPAELHTINVSAPNSGGLSISDGRRLYLQFGQTGTIVSGGNINIVGDPITIFTPEVVEFVYINGSWFVVGVGNRSLNADVPKTVTKTIFPREISVINGNAMLLTMSTSQITGGYFFQNTAAQFDTLQVNVNLSGGSYEWGCYYAGGPTTGIVTPSFNNVASTTFDCYSAGLTYNQVVTRTFTAVNGINTLQTEVLTRNGSSSGWAFAFSYWWLRKL